VGDEQPAGAAGGTARVGLLGYATTPVLLWPDFKRGIPQWQVQNPMRTFAATCTNPSDMTPPDCIFSEAWTYARLKREYPDAYYKLRRLESRGRTRGSTCSSTSTPTRSSWSPSAT
jgi:hypothetical protein